MLEAKGNMLHVDCDALVVTTNGFTKTNGSCVMGRGIALQISNIFPSLPRDLGCKIIEKGNHVHSFNYTGCKETIVSFPVKPINEVFDGTNAVRHMLNRLRIGDSVPGWACKADPILIEQSLHELVTLADAKGWKHIVCPRFGCGAGELSWENIKPICESILDDRFVVYTF